VLSTSRGRTLGSCQSGRAIPVGREPELAWLHEFLAGVSDARGLVITGGPGIGKTTLWEAGIAEARTLGLRVLVSRASGADARLAFAAVIDLLDEVDSEELEVLSAPQRRALEVAVLRADRSGPHRSCGRSLSASSMSCAAPRTPGRW
jgi:AAA ATPase domain